jgi:NAD(P)-dependent dehydrogenase (short-subunit alcohol dehydrogenase family)
VKAQTVLVTGAGTGIGREAARMFADRGASVVLVGRRPEMLEGLAGEIAGTGGTGVPMPADVRDEASVRTLFASVKDRFGTVDVLVNCAGIAAPAILLHETGDDLWGDVIETNLAGVFRMVRAALPEMMERRRGVIVNVASVAGLVALPRSAAYGIAKSGVVALTRSVAVEYGPFGIRCNCVCPGAVLTPMTERWLSDPARARDSAEANPARRIARPAEIAHQIVHLASDDSSFVNGAVLVADGGFVAM